MHGTTPEEPSLQEQIRTWRNEHARLAGWLGALEGAAGTAPERTRSALRVDYLQRMDTLARAAVERASTLRSLAEQAETRVTGIADRRAELALRHAVGEIDADELRRLQGEEETGAARAAVEARSLRAAIAEVEALLAELGWGPELSDGAHNGEAADVDAADDLAFLDALPATPTPGGPRPQLPALPKAAPRTAAAKPPPTPAPAAEEPSPSARRVGLTCRACGRRNDATLWYCDGCGAELA